MGYRLKQPRGTAPSSPSSSTAKMTEQQTQNVIDQVAAKINADINALLDGRDRANRQRANHEGTQPIKSVDQLATILAQKANGSALHQPVALHPESEPGLELDGQVLRYTAPEIPAAPPMPEPIVHATAVGALEDVTEPKFGVVYAVAGQGSFMLSGDGTQWIQIGNLAV
ncbi:MAG: hypothetical protein AAFV88_14110 [Planctomycetota bacterium]